MAALESTISPIQNPESAPAGPPPWSLTDRVLLAVVVALAVAVAGVVYLHFRAVHRHLWDSSTHDRNAHYLFSLKLIADLQSGHIYDFLEEIDGARAWPPLPGMVNAALLLAAGRDYRLAVLPSLVSWVGLAVLAFLIARRILPQGGAWAGLVAALFFLASPGHRGYATDIMVENVGACLCLAVLYCYLLVVQDGTAASARWLGLVLTALCVTKYNYWVLALLPLILVEMLTHPRQRWQTLRVSLAGLDWSSWIRQQPRNPLNYLLVLTLGVVAAVYAHGNRPFQWGERSFTIFPPHNVVQIAYWLFFAQLVLWWRAVGHVWVGRLDMRLRQLVAWHFWPVAVYFLLPKHVGFFLWYISPANAGTTERTSLWDGIRFYTQAVVEKFHPSLWAVWLAAALFVLAFLALRRWRAGAAAVVLFFALAAWLTFNHPNHQERYALAWVGAGWIVAGLGAGTVLALLPAWIVGGRIPVRALVGGAAAASLAWLVLPPVLQAYASCLGGPRPDLVSVLDLTDYYLPDLASSKQGTVLSAVPVRFLAQWTYLERYARPNGLEQRWWGFGAPGEANRQGFQRWLQSTRSDTLVYFDALPDRNGFWEPTPEVRPHAEIRDLLFSQQDFRLVKRRDFPGHACSVSVWKRVEKQAVKR